MACSRVAVGRALSGGASQSSAKYVNYGIARYVSYVQHGRTKLTLGTMLHACAWMGYTHLEHAVYVAMVSSD